MSKFVPLSRDYLESIAKQIDFTKTVPVTKFTYDSAYGSYNDIILEDGYPLMTKHNSYSLIPVLKKYELSLITTKAKYSLADFTMVTDGEYHCKEYLVDLGYDDLGLISMCEDTYDNVNVDCIKLNDNGFNSFPYQIRRKLMLGIGFNYHYSKTPITSKRELCSGLGEYIGQGYDPVFYVLHNEHKELAPYVHMMVGKRVKDRDLKKVTNELKLAAKTIPVAWTPTVADWRINQPTRLMI